MAGSYWSACTLHAGVELDLFTLLSETPATAIDLSARSGLSERGLTMLLDALAALELLQKTVAALDPEGLLLVQEFILEDDRAKPVFPALFSLNMLLGTPAGKAYSECEIVLLLQKAGLERVERLPIDLPNGAGVICGRRPA